MKNVIIIGSGIGGLMAGNLLAKKGHNVTIFEAHNMPGGYTAGFFRKGYYFESGTINFEASPSVFMAMKDIGVFDKIDFYKLKTRFFSEDFDEIPENYNDYKKMLFSSYPNDKLKLDMIFSIYDKVYDMMGALKAPLPTFFSGFSFIKSMLPYIPYIPKTLKLSKVFGDLTSSEFAARYFEKDSRLFRMFKGFSYPDMPAMAVPSSLAANFDDVWTLKGGMQSWADVLAENFVRLGGKLRLKSYVDKIVTENKAAVGVSCKNTIYNADYIISAGDYKKTFMNLLDDRSLIPQLQLDNICKADISEGFFTVYLGLNMSNEALCKYMKVPHVFTCDEKPGYDIYNSLDEDFFIKTSVSLYSPSMINPKLAPEGKSSLMLQTMVPYRWMNNWGGGDKQSYKQLKVKATNEMIDNISGLIPGLKDCIVYKDAATPLTYERFTHNTDGATSAWSWNPYKKFYKNAFSVNVETPVINLFIGSCWAFQIGGVPGALSAAYQCANRIK